MNEIERATAIERMNQNKKSTMTVKELYDKLAVFIKEGNGDAMLEVDDGFGGANCIFKDAKVYVGSANEELYGKWCNIDFQ